MCMARAAAAAALMGFAAQGAGAHTSRTMTFSVWISHAIKLGRRLRASTVPGRADVRRDTGALVDPRSAADAIVAGEVETLAALVARGRSNRAGAIAFGHHATLLQHVLAEAPRHWPLLQRPRSGGASCPVCRCKVRVS